MKSIRGKILEHVAALELHGSKTIRCPKEKEQEAHERLNELRIEVLANSADFSTLDIQEISACVFALGLELNEFKNLLIMLSEFYLENLQFWEAITVAISVNHFSLIKKVPFIAFAITAQQEVSILDAILRLHFGDSNLHENELKRLDQALGGDFKALLANSEELKEYVIDFVEYIGGNWSVYHDYEVDIPVVFEPEATAVLVLADRFYFPTVEIAKKYSGFVLPFWEMQ